MSAVIDRLPPQNPEAEEAVLGSLLMDPSAVHTVRPILKPDDCYRGRNGAILAAMYALSDRHEPVDFATVSDELRRSGKYDDAGGFAYLSQLVNSVPTAVHVEHYAGIVERTAIKRRLISMAGKIAALAYDETAEVDNILPQALNMLLSARKGSGRRVLSPSDQAALFAEMLMELEDGAVNYIPTGLPDLDRATGGGFEPAQLIVLMALPSMGKSAVGQSIARNVGRRGKQALFCSVEMSERQLVRRNAASSMRIDWHEFQSAIRRGQVTPDMKRAINLATDQMAKSNLHIYYKPGMTTADIRAEAMQLKATSGLDFLVVDYLQILSDSTGENRNVQVGRMCRNLKVLAGDLEVPVLLLSQMNREYKDRADKRPTMSDARDSGEIEQHVDILLGLYRDDFFYKPGQMIDPRKGLTDDNICVANRAELIILKQRDGPLATCNLTFLPSTAEYVGGTSEREE